MNAFQRMMQRAAKGLFGIEFGVQGAGDWQYAQEWIRGAMNPGRTDQLTEPFRQQSTLSIAISTLVEDSASIPWEIFPKGAEEPIEDHPVLDLWTRPNADMYGSQLWVGSYTSYWLWGEFFWYYPDLNVGRNGGPRALRRASGEIMLLDPRAIKIKRGEDGRPAYFLRRNGEDMPLDEASLTKGMRFNPYNPLRGLSKVDSVMAEISGDYSAANWNERFFSEQNAIPSGLLIPSQGSVSTGDQREEMLRMWNQRHAGTKRKVGMLPAGWDWKDLGVTQREMDFRQGRIFNREEILAAFGIPPLIAGFLDTTIKYNAQEQREVYWQGTQTRFLGWMQEIINHDFLPKIGQGDVLAFPKWEAVKSLTENMADKVEIAKSLWSMGVPFEQINERLELGFDPEDIPGSDIGYLPFSVTPADMASVPMTLPPTQEPPPTTMGQAVRMLPPVVADQVEARRGMVWKNLIDRTRDIELRFDRVVRSQFKEIEDLVLDSVEGVKGWLARQDREPEVVLFDLDDQKRKLQKRTEPIHRAALKRGGESVLVDVGLSGSFDLLDPRVLASMAEFSYKIAGIVDTVERALRESLIEGITGGETERELAERVRHVMGVSRSRSRTIARTETGFAFNSGRYLSMKQQGIDKHEWLSSRDPDVRDSHRAVDGEVRTTAEFFSNGLQFPNDPSGPPGEIINCRCVALPVVE